MRLSLASFTSCAVLMTTALVALAQGSPAQGCGGDHPLPNSGLCPSEALALMPPPDPDFIAGLGLFGCRSVPMDGPIIGTVMLYHAAQCDGKPAVLEAGIGAHSGSIDVWGGGMNPDVLKDPYQVAVILDAPQHDPTADLLRWTRASLENDGASPEEIAACAPRPAPEIAADAWVVDDKPAGYSGSAEDGPRWACGRYGYTEESRAYWRVTQGFAFYFDLGQGAYQDFDPTSLTMIAKTPTGWATFGGVADAGGADSGVADDGAVNDGAVNDGGAEPTSDAPNAYGVTHIAGGAETYYGTARGWTVYSAKLRGEFGYCVGETEVDGINLRIGFDGGQWQIALPKPNPRDHIESLEIDGRRWTVIGTIDATHAYAWLGLPELDAIKNGNLMILDIGRASFDYPLRGTAATILKVQECVTRG